MVEDAPWLLEEDEAVTKAQRDQLIKDNIGLTLWHARQFAAKHGKQVESGDYVTAAYLAMVDAAGRYEPTMACTFEQFSRYRIYGAMMDQLRKEVGRTDTTRRRKMREAEHHCDRLACIDPGYRRVESADLVDHLSHMVPDDRSESLVRMRAAGLNNREIGDRLGLCESRVSQLFHRVIRPHAQCLLDA